MKIYLIATVACLSLFSSRTYSQEDTSQLKVFEKVEIEAQYPGGFNAWKTFLEKNLNSNVPVKNGAPAGLYKVFIQFIVDKNGKVTDLVPLTNEGYGMEAEVIRMLKKSGSWQPAIMDGRTVNAYRKQPVSFMVTDDSFEFSPYTIEAGKDNEISIAASKIDSKDLAVSISRGSIVSTGSGKFKIHVNGPERVTLTLVNQKKNKQVGKLSLSVTTNDN